MAVSFGDIIKHLRDRKHLTQGEVALKADVDKSTVQKAERIDDPNKMYWRNVIALAEALGTTEEALMEMWRGKVVSITIDLGEALFNALGSEARRSDVTLEQHVVTILEGRHGTSGRLRIAAQKDPKPKSGPKR